MKILESKRHRHVPLIYTTRRPAAQGRGDGGADPIRYLAHVAKPAKTLMDKQDPIPCLARVARPANALSSLLNRNRDCAKLCG